VVQKWIRSKKRRHCKFAWIGIHRSEDDSWVSTANKRDIVYSNWLSEEEAMSTDKKYAIMNSDGYWIPSDNTAIDGCEYVTGGKLQHFYNVICAMDHY